MSPWAQFFKGAEPLQLPLTSTGVMGTQHLLKSWALDLSRPHLECGGKNSCLLPGGVRVEGNELIFVEHVEAFSGTAGGKATLYITVGSSVAELGCRTWVS